MYKNSDNKKDHYKSYQKVWRKNRSDNGICRHCNMAVCCNSRIFCQKHYEHRKKYMKIYNASLPKREWTEKRKLQKQVIYKEREEIGQCRYCDNSVCNTSKRFCDKHRLMAKGNVTVNEKAKREWIANIKTSYGCANPACGWKSEFKSYHLHFHHIDPSTKIANVTEARGIQWTINEMNKCCIVCANCHQDITWGDLDCSSFVKCNISINGKIL